MLCVCETIHKRILCSPQHSVFSLGIYLLYCIATCVVCVCVCMVLCVHYTRVFNLAHCWRVSDNLLVLCQSLWTICTPFI